MGRLITIDIEQVKEELEEYRYKYPILEEQKATNDMIDIFESILDFAEVSDLK